MTQQHTNNNAAHNTESGTMTNSITITLNDETLDALAAKIAAHLNVNIAVTPTEDSTPPFAAPADGKKRKDGKIVDDAPDTDDDESGDDEGPSQKDREAELRAMRITSLRKIAVGHGFDADDVKDADKDTLVDSILAEEFGDDSEDDEDDDADDVADDDTADDDDEDSDDEDDEDDDESDESEGDEYTKDELDAMSLAELKSLAKDAGYTAADLKGLDQDDVVALLIGDDEEDDEDEDESDEYTEADLKAMGLPDLKALAKEWGVKIAKDAKKPAIIKALLAD